jgi:hypothetical protein
MTNENKTELNEAQKYLLNNGLGDLVLSPLTTSCHKLIYASDVMTEFASTRPNASEGVDVEYRLTWCDECEKALVTNSTRCGCKNLLKEFPIHLVRNPDSRIKEAIEEVDNSIKAIHEEYGCEVPSDSIILTLTKIKTTLEK